jgi:hypothetical protein
LPFSPGYSPTTSDDEELALPLPLGVLQNYSLENTNFNLLQMFMFFQLAGGQNVNFSIKQ